DTPVAARRAQAGSKNRSICGGIRIPSPVLPPGTVRHFRKKAPRPFVEHYTFFGTFSATLEFPTRQRRLNWSGSSSGMIDFMNNSGHLAVSEATARRVKKTKAHKRSRNRGRNGKTAQAN